MVAGVQYDRGQRRRQLIAALLADVFQGRLRAGQHLVTQELAKRFQVSHTPVREALITLAGMGIVEWQPNRGATVRRVTRRDVEEICQVRRLLECAATRRACGRISLADLQQLQQEFRRLAQIPVARLRQREARHFIDAARRADSKLHDLIAASCGNAFLAQELDRLKLLFRVFRDVAWQQEELRHDYRRLASEAWEHLAIVEGLIKNDGRTAARAMSQHIRSGARYWGRSLVSLPESMPVASPNGEGDGNHRSPAKVTRTRKSTSRQAKVATQSGR